MIYRAAERMGKEMDKFCVFCGKPLEEGQTCDCQTKIESEPAEAMPGTSQPDEAVQLDGTAQPDEAVQPQQQEESVQVNIRQAYDGRLPENTEEPELPPQTAVQIRPQSYMIPQKECGAFRNYVKRCWVILTRFFANPVQIIRIAAEKKDAAAGVLFWVIGAILTGLLPAVGTPLLLEKIVGASVLRMIDFSAVRLCYTTASLNILWTAALSALTFAFAKAMRSRASFKSVMGAVGVSYIGTAAITLISFLITLIAPGFGLFFYLCVQGITLVLLYIAFAQSLDIGYSKTLYCLLYALAAIGLLLALYVSGVVMEIAHSIAGSAFGSLGGFNGGLLR